MRKGVEPKTLKEKATKKSTVLAPNFRKSEEYIQKEKEEKEKLKLKQALSLKKNRNTSDSADRNNSLPRIKNSMSNENISPPKVKKSKSSQGVMSPSKKRSSKQSNGSVRKTRSSQNSMAKSGSNQPDISEPSPMFSIGSPGMAIWVLDSRFEE